MIVWVGARRLDAALRDDVQTRYHVRLRRRETALLRRCIGTAYPPRHETAMVMHGIVFTSEEVRQAYNRVLFPLCEEIRRRRPRHVTVCGTATRLDGLRLLLTDWE